MDIINELSQAGLSILIQDSLAILKVNVHSQEYLDTKLELQIKNTIKDEPDWYNTTIVDIYFKKPVCDIDQAYLASFESTQIYVLEATQ